LKKLVATGLTLSLVLFSACSSKKVFEPENTSSSWDKYQSIGENIIDITSTAALLENRKVLAGDKTIDIEIPENYRLIGSSDGWIISATINGNLKLQSVNDSAKVIEFEVQKTVASASIQGDLLAVVFADNELGLYTLSNKELLLKEKVGESLAIDSRIATPYFVGGVVVYPTLDGKLVIINPEAKKRLRTTILSSEEFFNNVIYFNLVDQKIIAATAHKVLTMAQEENRAAYEIRNMISNNDGLYIATKQGEVIALTPSLQLRSKLKFPFAHFLGMIAKEDKLYILEKEGYLIVAPKDLSSYTIHPVDLDEGFVYVSEKGFFVHDELISIE
jgi:hypothetical protein